jgi:hypothetical protein
MVLSLEIAIKMAIMIAQCIAVVNTKRQALDQPAPVLWFQQFSLVAPRAWCHWTIHKHKYWLFALSRF